MVPVMARVADFVEGQSVQAWQPARAFLVASGVFHLFLGSVGFIASSSFATGAGDSGHIFSIFETNGWHNLAGLGLGFASLAFAWKPETARLGALSLGTTMVIVTVLLAFVEPGTFLLASNGWDQVLHALAGTGGVVAGLATRPSPQAQPPSARAA